MFAYSYKTIVDAVKEGRYRAKLGSILLQVYKKDNEYVVLPVTDSFSLGLLPTSIANVLKKISSLTS